jgi:branched-chain amino acid transport system ATP-binding protein
MPESPVLDVRDVYLAYAENPVVRHVSLTVGPGEVVALLGPNGAGKSTLMLGLTGFLPVRGGEILFDGAPVAKLGPKQRAQAGMLIVPERGSSFHGLTVEQHFMLLRRDWRAARSEVGRYFPRLLELSSRKVGTLSGGERQMLSIGCALARHPRVLLLDELSLGLAPIIVEKLLPVIRTFADENGCGVLLVEQHVHLALEIADRGYIMTHGEITLEAPTSELRDNPLVANSYLGQD